MNITSKFRFECPRCGQPIVAENECGSSGSCPTCGQEFEFENSQPQAESHVRKKCKRQSARVPWPYVVIIFAFAAAVGIVGARIALMQKGVIQQQGWPSQEFAGLNVTLPQQVSLADSTKSLLPNGASEHEQLGTTTGEGYTLRVAHFSISPRSAGEFTPSDLIDGFEKDFDARADLTKIEQHVKMAAAVPGLTGVQLISSGYGPFGAIVQNLMILGFGPERWVLKVETLKKDEVMGQRILSSVKVGPALASIIRLQGKWKVVQAIRNGEARPDFVNDDNELEFSYRFGGLHTKGAENWGSPFEIDTATQPLRIAFKDLKTGRAIRCPFEFVGTQLRIGLPLGIDDDLKGFDPPKSLPQNPGVGSSNYVEYLAARSRVGILELRAEREP